VLILPYAQLVKLYGNAPDGGPERKYNPNICLGAPPATVSGIPDMARVSMSYVERQKLTMRMSIRRLGS
jgi:hypothetical protein